MKLYRIAHCRHIEDMTGTGGLYASGRWHPKGIRILYFSEHISLAKLETLANSNLILNNMCLMTASLDEKINIEILEREKLPERWDSYPYSDSLHGITQNWLSSNKSVGLKVPSAQSTSEFNYLINPSHKDISKIEVVSCEKITFDLRLQLK
jgi:RES domain-containing protein